MGWLRFFLVAGLSFAACSPVEHADPPVEPALDVLTFQYSSSRHGVALRETVLTPQNVNASTFGKKFSFTVDGFVYAQPLYVAQLTVAGKEREVLFVATQHDTVYAFDASGEPRTPLWRSSLLGNAETPVPSADVLSPDILPEIGITGTPVIDRAAGLLYVVAKSKRADLTYVQRLHALRLADGSEGIGSPVDIEAKVATTATVKESVDGYLTFEPLRHNQRSALALIGGRVWISWAGHSDMPPYHGWFVGYDTRDLTRPPSAWITTPDGYAGGIWMGASGASTDAEGNIYVASGNGTFSDDVATDAERTNFGSSALKLHVGDDGKVTLVDWFAPQNQHDLSRDDQDFGTNGAVILPDQPGNMPHRLVTASKSGILYVLNRDDMGRYQPNADRVIQTISVGSKFFISNPVFFKRSLYLCPNRQTLMAFAIDPATGLFDTNATFAPACGDCFRRGSTPAISANGEQDAIVWAIDNSTFATTVPAILRAYTEDLTTLIYESPADAANVDAAAPAVKFTVPVIANGRVYFGGQRAVSVYALR